MNRFKEKIFPQIFILAGLMVSIPSFADRCHDTVKKYGKRCPEETTRSLSYYEKNCEDAMWSIRQGCASESSEWGARVATRKNSVRSLIELKGEDVTDLLHVEVAHINAEISTINSQIKIHAQKILKIKEGAAAILTSVKSESESFAKEYESQINAIIKQVNSSEDPDYLLSRQQAVADINMSTIENLALQQENLVAMRIELAMAEDELIGALGRLSAKTIDELNIEGISQGSKILDAALKWQIQIQYQVVDLSTKVQSAIDQKLSVIYIKRREEAIDDEARKRLQTARHILLSTQYLADTQNLIQKLTTPQRSTFNNLSYYGETIALAKQLKGIQQFCDSSTTHTWQLQGCTRANQFKTNVARILGSTTLSGMSFATRSFDNSTSSDVITLNQELKQRIADKDLEGAVVLYDLILEKMENNNV